MRATSAAVVVFAANALSAEAQAADAPPPRPNGSLRTMEALGCGVVGMSMGGGVAVLLPLYAFEVGVGLIDRLDFVARFETVIGVFHYPYVGLRLQPFEVGDWSFGASVHANYSFFGIKTDQTNFTSTFYSSFEFGASGPVTDESELVFAAGGELDFFDYEIVEDEGMVVEDVHYDATVVRTAFKTVLTDDLDGYAQLRLRIPVETFVFEAQELYVIPMLEIGGTWTFGP